MKKLIKRFLRTFGLMFIADKLRFSWIRIRNFKDNAAFKRSYSDVILPPDYLMYESFQLDYSRYFINGKKTTEWLIDLVKPFHNLNQADVLDWGCGPGRLIRHLPELLKDAGSFTGTDYNEKTIQWCQDNLKGIDFAKNDLMPPLPFPEESFDLIYAISIFTHLSETAHEAWLQELLRVVKPKGIVFLTLHGEAFQDKLESAEKADFQQKKLVVR